MHDGKIMLKDGQMFVNLLAMNHFLFMVLAHNLHFFFTT